MNMLSLLRDLQLEQQRHDDIAHRDILCLPKDEGNYSAPMPD